MHIISHLLLISALISDCTVIALVCSGIYILVKAIIDFFKLNIFRKTRDISMYDYFEKIFFGTLDFMLNIALGYFTIYIAYSLNSEMFDYLKTCMH